MLRRLLSLSAIATTQLTVAHLQAEKSPLLDAHEPSYRTHPNIALRLARHQQAVPNVCVTASIPACEIDCR